MPCHNPCTILHSPLWPGLPSPGVPQVAPLHGVEAGGGVVGRVQAPGVTRAVTPRPRAVSVRSSASEHGVTSGTGVSCPVIPLTEAAHVSVTHRCDVLMPGHAPVSPDSVIGSEIGARWAASQSPALV